MTKLKPCPFCGGEAKVSYFSVNAGYMANCNNADCFVYPSVWGVSAEQATERWNTRADDAYSDDGK